MTDILAKVRRLQSQMESGKPYDFSQGIWKEIGDEIERLRASLKSAERWLSAMHSDSDGDEITELRDVHSAAWKAIDKMRDAIARQNHGSAT